MCVTPGGVRVVRGVVHTVGVFLHTMVDWGARGVASHDGGVHSSRGGLLPSGCTVFTPWCELDAGCRSSARPWQHDLPRGLFPRAVGSGRVYLGGCQRIVMCGGRGGVAPGGYWVA